MKIFLPIGLVLTLGGCVSTGAEPISVQRLEVDHAKLTFKTIHVRGWLTPCGGRSCVLTNSLDYAEWLDRAVTANSSETVSPSPQDNAAVSLGAVTAFDREVAYLRDSNAEVIIEARVTDRCWLKPPEIDQATGQQTIEICADRGGQLEPIRLVKVIRAVPLPSKDKD